MIDLSIPQAKPSLSPTLLSLADLNRMVLEALRLRDEAYSSYLFNRCPQTFQAYRKAGDEYARIAAKARTEEMRALALCGK